MNQSILQFQNSFLGVAEYSIYSQLPFLILRLPYASPRRPSLIASKLDMHSNVRMVKTMFPPLRHTHDNSCACDAGHRL